MEPDYKATALDLYKHLNPFAEGKFNATQEIELTLIELNLRAAHHNGVREGLAETRRIFVGKD